MKFGIDQKSLKDIKKEIISNLGACKKPKLYIYGSRVKGNYRKFSDIDLLFVAEEFDEDSLSLIDFEKLDIPFKVDFVLASKLFDLYQEEIFSHMVELNLSEW